MRVREEGYGRGKDMEARKEGCQRREGCESRCESERKDVRDGRKGYGSKERRKNAKREKDEKVSESRRGRI